MKDVLLFQDVVLLIYLISLQLFSHFFHVPIILSYQRSHYTATQTNDVSVLGGKIFFLNFVFTITLSCWISSECCVSNVSTKWYETDELTLYLRSRAQETQCVFPPQPNKHKACKGWGLAVVNCIKNLLFSVQKKKKQSQFFFIEDAKYLINFRWAKLA